jgi:hypothetical protein
MTDNNVDSSPARSSERRPNNRRGTVGSASEENISSAQALILRRREMRERIAERQSNAIEKRQNQNSSNHRSISDLDPSDKEEVNALANDMLHEWNDVTDSNLRRERRSSREKREGRRGRSRSVVRDSLSKIRSASLNAFRKSSRSVNGSLNDYDGNTVDTGKKSTASSLLGRITNRSLSRSRSIASDTDGAFRSTTPADEDEKSSRSAMMRRFSLKSKGNVRSREKKSNSFHRETQSEINFGIHRDVWSNDDDDEGFSQSSLMRRLSKTSPARGRPGRNSAGDGFTTRSESCMNSGDAWFEEDEFLHSRFSKKSSTSTNPFD